MAANINPLFPLTGASYGVLINAANTAADGSGTLFDLLVGSTNGTRVDGVIISSHSASLGAYAAKVVRIFITNNSGANPLMLYEITMVAATRSATLKGAAQTFFFDKTLVLASGQKLQVCQSVYGSALDASSVIAFAAGNF